jgi:Ca2+/H+ antiporter, TMEM165/GDT1 family
MTALLSSFLLIFLAEMADKTQLLTLCLTCRYPARKVLLGVALAIALLNLIAVGLGGLAESYLPGTAVTLVAGILFLGFGLWLFFSAGPPDPDEVCETKPSRNVVLAVAGAFFLAELGDKTQLAALSLGARFGDFWPVWLGATAAMIAANGLAVGGGALLGSRLNQRTLQRVSAVLFIVFGLWTLSTLVLA